jgi:hypothetical protein
MHTFFALRHMDNVEWVTDHVPWSHSTGGAVKDIEDGSFAWYFVAERREIAGLGLVASPRWSSDDGVLTKVAAPPGDPPGAEWAILDDLRVSVLGGSSHGIYCKDPYLPTVSSGYTLRTEFGYFGRHVSC